MSSLSGASKVASSVTNCGLGLWLILGLAWTASAEESKPAQSLAGQKVSPSASGSAPNELSFKARSALATQYFQTNHVPTIRLTVPPKALDQLRQEPRAYIRASVAEDGVVYEEVGLHLKGAAGSFRQVDDRPAFTLNFDKFKDGQHFHGLDKLHLNNSVQDPSYSTELLCGELFLSAGIPAARATHALVYLNDRPLGLYVLKEGFDKSFLKRNGLDPAGNLYDSGFIREITEPLDLITGDAKAGRGDLESVVAACNLQDSTKRFEALQRVVDMDKFLTFLAMEIVTWHWDGYYLKHNNYRVYSDPQTKKVQFLPHGMDQMFWSPNGPIMPPADGMVAQAVLNTPAGKAQYKAKLSQITTNLLNADALAARLRAIQSKIRPALASYDEGAAKSHDAAMKKIIRAVTQRVDHLNESLAAEEIRPVVFDATGTAVLKDWRKQLDSGEALFKKIKFQNINCLQIDAVAPEEDLNCLASFRSRVLLAPGAYRFQGRGRTEDVEPPGKSTRGVGAGLRVSMQRRTHSIVGTHDWQNIDFDFAIRDQEQTIQLICDLRAKAGRAWFDLESLKLIRLGDAPKEDPDAVKTKEPKPVRTLNAEPSAPPPPPPPLAPPVPADKPKR